METRKQINRNRFLFFNVGLIISCSFVLWAFQWKAPERNSLIEATVHTPDEIQIVATFTPPKQEEQKEEKQEEPDKKNEEFSERTRLKVADFAPKPRRMPMLHLRKPDSGPTKLVLPLADASNIVVPDVLPSFPEGNAALKSFLEQNLRYPEYALDAGLTGRVVVKFVVDVNGNIIDVRVLSSDLGQDGAREALRVMKLMPKWVPGYYKGNKVNSYFIQKFSFELM